LLQLSQTTFSNGAWLKLAGNVFATLLKYEPYAFIKPLIAILQIFDAVALKFFI